MRHARTVMHFGISYPWFRGNVPGIPGACEPAILRISQEAHSDVHEKYAWLLTMCHTNICSHPAVEQEMSG